MVAFRKLASKSELQNRSEEPRHECSSLRSPSWKGNVTALPSAALRPVRIAAPGLHCSGAEERQLLSSRRMACFILLFLIFKILTRRLVLLILERQEGKWGGREMGCLLYSP